MRNATMTALLSLSVYALGCEGGPPSAADAPEHHAALDSILTALSRGSAPPHVPADSVVAPSGATLSRTGTARSHHDLLYAAVDVNGARGLMFVIGNGPGDYQHVVVFAPSGASASGQVQDYQEAWNERLQEPRQERLDRGFAENGRY